MAGLVSVVTSTLAYDEAATPGAVAQRDSSGDLTARRQKANSGVDNSGGQRIGVVQKSANFVCDDTKSMYEWTGASSNGTATLPTAASPNAGLRITFKRTDVTYNLQIGCTGGQTIDGVSTKTLSTQYAAITVVSNGSNWIVEDYIGTIT